jgi:hypothetical protein
MAFMNLAMENPNTGAIKEAPIGFSWTTLLFGFFPALLRGHISMAIVMFLLSFATFGLSGLVFAFIYNKMYVKHLIGEGFKAGGTDEVVGTASGKLQMKVPTLPRI